MLPDRTIDKDSPSTPEDNRSSHPHQHEEELEELDEELMAFESSRNGEEASSLTPSSNHFIKNYNDEFFNQQEQQQRVKMSTLYETIEYYLLYSDYRVDQQLKELNALEQALMRVHQQESSQENSSKSRTHESNRSFQSTDEQFQQHAVGSTHNAIQKQLKRVRKIKTFMDEYGTVCRDFLSRIKQHPLGEINIDASLKILNGRRNADVESTTSSSKETDNLVEDRLVLLHSAFHTKCVRNHLLPFIRKSLLLKSKQNIERDKLYANIHTTEDLLLLYQLKHGMNEKMRLSTEYIHENADRKLQTFKQEVEQCYQQVISNKQK